MKRTVFLYLLILILTLLYEGNAISGNKKMVEKRVRELDELNQQVVGTIPNIPRYGQIDIKANIYPYDHHNFRFDLIEQEIIPLPYDKAEKNKGGKKDE